MLQLEELNQNYCETIQKEKAAHAKSAAEEIAYVNSSTAKYHGRCVSTLYIPKMFTAEDIRIFQNLIRVLYGIFDKVTDRYRADASYRRLFGFSRELEALILG